MELVRIGKGKEWKGKSNYPSVPAQRSFVNESDLRLALNPGVEGGLDLSVRQCRSRQIYCYRGADSVWWLEIDAQSLELGQESASERKRKGRCRARGRRGRKSIKGKEREEMSSSSAPEKEVVDRKRSSR